MATSNKLVIVCGAGISLSAGIPTYRSGGETEWNIADMKTICSKGAEFSRESLDFYNNFRRRLGGLQPSVVHQTISDLQKTFGKDRVVVFTQNIDDLLEKAGCKEVSHVHGAARQARCVACGYIKDGVEFLDNEYCSCGGRLRNNIVFYGEKGNYEGMIGTLLDMEKDDVFMLVGTSGQAINIDLIVRCTDCYKVYVNPVIEPSVEISKYHTVLLRKCEECVDMIKQITCDKLGLGTVD
jgi:NAD-dependent deacetylase